MPLSSRDLETPHRPARQDYGLYQPEMTRIEASFYHGRVDEMQQWLDSGALEKLMQAKSRSTTAYHDVLPACLLKAGRLSALDSFGMSLPDCEKWWGVLMELRTKDRPRPVTDWLVAGSSLPWPLFDRWVKEGSSPHSRSATRQGSSSPFLSLLRDTIHMHKSLSSHRKPGWPKMSELFRAAQNRVQEWADLPGMQPHDTDEALKIVSCHALLSAMNRPDDWLVRLRDSIIAQGASCTDLTMKDVVLPALAPALQVKSASSPRGPLMDLDLRRQEREVQRTSPDHQARVTRWTSALFATPQREGRSAWRASTDTFSAVLRNGNNLHAASLMLDHNPTLLDPHGKEISYGSSFFSPRKEPDSEASHINRLKGLLALRSHPNGPTDQWVVRAANDASTNRLLSVPEMSAWLDLCVEEPARSSLVHTWFTSCVCNDFPVEKIAPVLSLLHARTGLDFLQCPSGVEEGSKDDLRHVRQYSVAWFKDEKFAPLLRALPGPISSRIAKMHLFFVDPQLPTKDKTALLAHGLQVGPDLLATALREHLGRFEWEAGHTCIPEMMDILKSFSAVAVKVPDGEVEELWRLFGEHMSPRYDRKGHSLSAALELVDTLSSLVPLSKSNGQPLREMLHRENQATEQGWIKRDDVTQAWASMDPLVVDLLSRGLDFQLVPPSRSSSPFSQVLTSHRDHQELERATVDRPVMRPVRRM